MAILSNLSWFSNRSVHHYHMCHLRENVTSNLSFSLLTPTLLSLKFCTRPDQTQSPRSNSATKNSLFIPPAAYIIIPPPLGATLCYRHTHGKSAKRAPAQSPLNTLITRLSP